MHKQGTNNSDSRTLGGILSELCLPAPIAKVEVQAFVIDSRKVRNGDVFVALRGEKINAEEFISQAIECGAVAILIEADDLRAQGVVKQIEGAHVIAIDNLRCRLGTFISRRLGEPSKKLELIGVTGTNGKSTCVSLIEQLALLMGLRSGSIGTLGLSIKGEHVKDFGLTTPDVLSVHYGLAEVVEHVDLIAMEVSSHGLVQHRVAGVGFDIAIFTNLTHDHLDYHLTLEEYCSAKQRLFEFDNLSVAIVNLDDPVAQVMLQAAKDSGVEKIFTYSLTHFAADVYASDMQFTPEGISFELTTPWGSRRINSPLLGEFNVYNLMAAVLALCALDYDFDRVLDCIAALKCVPGRMQKVQVHSDVSVVVDYAHTPDALEQCLKACKQHSQGRMSVVFGCGGDRDIAKRPMMAKTAETYADSVVVTSDNPRTENPKVIAEQICVGFELNTHKVCLDRHEAIVSSICAAKPMETVLLAGKGHEKYQLVGDQKLEFDDVTVAKHALALRAADRASGGPL